MANFLSKTDNDSLCRKGLYHSKIRIFSLASRIGQLVPSSMFSSLVSYSIGTGKCLSPMPGCSKRSRGKDTAEFWLCWKHFQGSVLEGGWVVSRSTIMLLKSVVLESIVFVEGVLATPAPAALNRLWENPGVLLLTHTWGGPCGLLAAQETSFPLLTSQSWYG